MKKIYLIDFKAAWCSYFALKGQTQDFDIYSINEMTKQIQKYPFFHSCLLIVEDAWRYLREATQRFQRFPASKYFKSALGASRGVTSGETPSICIQWQELNFMEMSRGQRHAMSLKTHKALLPECIVRLPSYTDNEWDVWKQQHLCSWTLMVENIIK